MAQVERPECLRRGRRMYKVAPAGIKALQQARSKVDELHHEMHEAHPRTVSDLGGR
jgi:hypothetical protein